MLNERPLESWARAAMGDSLWPATNELPLLTKGSCSLKRPQLKSFIFHSVKSRQSVRPSVRAARKSINFLPAARVSYKYTLCSQSLIKRKNQQRSLSLRARSRTKVAFFLSPWLNELIFYIGFWYCASDWYSVIDCFTTDTRRVSHNGMLNWMRISVSTTVQRTKKLRFPRAICQFFIYLLFTLFATININLRVLNDKFISIFLSPWITSILLKICHIIFNIINEDKNMQHFRIKFVKGDSRVSAFAKTWIFLQNLQAG